MDDPKAVALANKQLIREAIAGYAVAAEYIERERIERLRQMTPEQSRADYAALVRFYELLKNRNDGDGLKRLEEWRLQEKIAMRRLFEIVARNRGPV